MPTLLLIIISVVWLAAATAGVALCRAAARGDADMSSERCDWRTLAAEEWDEVGAPPPDPRERPAQRRWRRARSPAT